MNDAGDIAEQGKYDVYPEMQADADLQEYAHWGQQDGEQYS